MKPPRTDEELTALAKDVWAGSIFTDRHVQTVRDLPLVFMPLGLMASAQLEELKQRVGQQGMIFQSLAKAAPMGVNGQPIFFSFEVLTNEEGERFWPILEKIKAAMEAI